MNKSGITLLLALGTAFGQPPPGRGYPGGPPRPEPHPPLDRVLRGGPQGRWWDQPEMVQKLGMTADQQKRMDDIFLQSRLKLIDLNAALQREETILDPLVQSDQPDDAKVLAQIDRVVQARAELEKADARMLMGIRRVLTPEQWKKLRSDDFNPPRDHRPDGRRPRPMHPPQ